MKKLIAATLLAVASFAGTAFAQDTQQAAAEAAAALEGAEDLPEKVEKPKHWNNSLLTNINFGQTYLVNWAAGGDNNVSLAGNVDANANYAKDKQIWNNRLQVDYGFLYSEDKPILQTTKDRFYLESKWGYETPVQHLSYSAIFDFKTQMGRNYEYKNTPTQEIIDKWEGSKKAAWEETRTLKSGLFAPAYINLGLGMLWTPAPWFSLNFAPLTGGVVCVEIPELRQTYGMELRDKNLDPDLAKPDDYRSARFELGAQLKADAGWVINDRFSYTTQLVLFSNYLKQPENLRVNWDNKVFCKLAKFFALTLSTNLIYDHTVKQKDWTGEDGKTIKVQAVQFKEFLEFGFTYTIAGKS